MPKYNEVILEHNHYFVFYGWLNAETWEQVFICKKCYKKAIRVFESSVERGSLAYVGDPITCEEEQIKNIIC